MEQLTLFYATVLGVALLGAGSPLNVLLAWGYVAAHHSQHLADDSQQPQRTRQPVLLSSLRLLMLAANGLVSALAD